MNRLSESKFSVALDWPRLTFFCTFIFTLVSVAGLSGLSTSNDYRSFLDADYPGMLELAEVESTFAENKRGLVLVQARQGDVYTASGLDAVRSLTEDLWFVDRVKRVDSIANFQHTRADGDDLYVDDLIPLQTILDEATVEAIRRISLSEPSIRGLLVSEDGEVAAISITFEFAGSDAEDQEVRNAVARQVNTLIQEYQARFPGLDFRGTGTFFADYYSDKYLREINTILLPIMLVSMMLLLAILLRSWSGLVAATTVVIGSGLITMGIFGWSRMVLEAVAAMGPIVIMTLAVADSVHIIVGAQAAYGRGMDKVEAIRESLRINFMPVFLTSLTTALGVITFVFTDFPSLRKLGLIIAVGVSIAFILSVTLLPVLLRWMPLHARSPHTLEQRISEWLSMFIVRRTRAILVVAVVISLALGLGVTRAVVDESFQDFFRSGTEIEKSIRIADEKLAGLLQLDVAIFSDRENVVADPEFLALLERFRGWVKQRENVTHVQTISDTFKRLNRSMHGDDGSWYKLPGSSELAAQYLLMYEMSLPIGLELSDQLNLDKSAVRLVVSARNVRSVNVLHLAQQIRDWFAAEAPQHRVVVTSLVSLMSEVTMYELVPKMARGAAIAILMVSLVLFFALRSWALGAFGMLANVVPILIGYGVWAWSGQVYNFVAISVAGICLGMVVDFAVHFLDKFRSQFRQTGDAEMALAYAYDKVASPIMITAVVLMAGFFVLSFTKTLTFIAMGLLTPIIIGLAVLFDLLVLPALLLVLYGDRPGTTPERTPTEIGR